MSGTIRITGLEAHGYHGVFEEEKAAGQAFLVDLELTVDTIPASRSDALGDTVDYGALAQATYDLVVGTRYNLIERLAEEIAAMILGLGGIEAVQVTVHKPQAPVAVPFRDVSVTIRRP
jgi:7,8-dihydroneopterin aldolase/epimerase/oxygenase